jgi:hypothetical protein
MACLSQGGHRVKLTTSVQCRSLRMHGPISVPSLHTSLRCGAQFSKRANLPLVHVQKRECVLLVRPSRPRVKQPFTTTVRIIRMCVLICLYCNRVNFLVLQVCMTQAKCLRVVTLVFPPGRVSAQALFMIYLIALRVDTSYKNSCLLIAYLFLTIY